MLETLMAKSMTALKDSAAGPAVQVVEQALKGSSQTLTKSLQVTFKLLGKTRPDIKDFVKDTLAAQLAGHVDNFLALREKLAGAEAQLNTVSEKLQEVVGRCLDKIKITSDKLSELHKFTNQGIGEIMGTIKMVPATVVSVKAIVKRIAGLLDQVHQPTQESKTAIMEATTLLHDCKQMLVDNRQVLFTEMQRHLADVNAKCDSVAEKL